ncbi:monoacylglycerol lipase-like [Amblyomma americanum]
MTCNRRRPWWTGVPTLVGHGESGGTRATVKSFDSYVDDILQHADLTRKKFSHKPIFLFGHSMKTVTKVLGLVLPSVPIAALDLALYARDPDVMSYMASDPLRYHGNIPLIWPAALIKAQDVS